MCYFGNMLNSEGHSEVKKIPSVAKQSTAGCSLTVSFWMIRERITVYGDSGKLHLRSDGVLKFKMEFNSHFGNVHSNH